MHLNFIINIETDLKNWQNSIKATSHGVDWKKFLPEDFLIARISEEGYSRNYINKKFYDSRRVSDFKKWLKENVNSAQIRDDLETLMGKKMPFEDVKIFITTYHRAPYNFEKGYFYIFESQKRERAITTIYHELMHLFFHKYYWNSCKKAGLDDKKIDFLKEALTILLNPILEKRILPLDKGYLIHQELRNKIKILAEDNFNFENILEESIKLVK